MLLVDVMAGVIECPFQGMACLWRSEFAVIEGTRINVIVVVRSRDAVIGIFTVIVLPADMGVRLVFQLLLVPVPFIVGDVHADHFCPIIVATRCRAAAAMTSFGRRSGG